MNEEKKAGGVEVSELMNMSMFCYVYEFGLTIYTFWCQDEVENLDDPEMNEYEGSYMSDSGEENEQIDPKDLWFKSIFWLLLEYRFIWFKKSIITFTCLGAKYYVSWFDLIYYIINQSPY